MNHDKMTLVIASIVFAGALTGVASAILLQQALAFRHHHMFILGIPGTSVNVANGVEGANGVMVLVLTVLTDKLVAVLVHLF